MRSIGGAILMGLLFIGCGSPTTNLCVASCDGRSCGSDGCGGTCGECDTGFTCAGDGTCVAGCTPSCASKECGDDGCGGSCGSCDAGFACGQAGACSLDLAHPWTITITNGTIQQDDLSGQPWDAAGGLPDPIVCLTINGAQSCTSVQQDTLTPVWNESFGPFPAAALESVTVSLEDSDLTVNDPICPPAVRAVSDQDFQNGGWTVGCFSGSFSAQLTP